MKFFIAVLLGEEVSTKKVSAISRSARNAAHGQCLADNMKDNLDKGPAV